MPSNRYGDALREEVRLATAKSDYLARQDRIQRRIERVVRNVLYYLFAVVVASGGMWFTFYALHKDNLTIPSPSYFTCAAAMNGILVTVDAIHTFVRRHD